MSMFDDGFDAGDALIIGGAMGFAEEAMRDEDEALLGEPEVRLEVLKLKEFKDVDLQIFKNTNPKLFEYIVEMVIKQKREWRRKIKVMRNNDDHELRAMEETEKLLNDQGRQI